MGEKTLETIEVGDVVEFIWDQKRPYLFLVGKVAGDGRFCVGDGTAYWNPTEVKIVAKASAPLLKRIEELEAEVERLRKEKSAVVDELMAPWMPRG